jgi:hypothetical protein
VKAASLAARDTDMIYRISSRDYLRRAKQCLTESDERFLFYAALELRSGVESRMQEYLEVWEHVTASKKKGWQIVNLGRSIENAFGMGDKILRWEVQERITRHTRIVFYYTPVTRKLRSNVNHLSNYLHAAKKPHAADDPWWTKLRELLEVVNVQLETATTGTLLGPALKKGNVVHMNVEIPPGVDHEAIRSILSKGETSVAKVDYLEQLPASFEPTAMAWKGDI